MARVYISLGSNIEREANTRSGIAALRAHYGELKLSSVYESEAVGFAGGSFYNMVIALDTCEAPETVVQVLKDMETRYGREHGSRKFSSRTLDLDMLLYDDRVLHASGIQVPRAEILSNAFVLWPLAEIAPDLVHPEKHKTYAELWREFDKSKQRLKPIAFRF